MGVDFDGIVRGEHTRVERERRSILTYGISLLLGSASLVMALAIHLTRCLGSGFPRCWTEWSATQVPYMRVGAVVAGVCGVFALWTTRRRGPGLSDRALAWGVVPVVALSVGVAVMFPLTLEFVISFPSFLMAMTATAAVVSAAAWGDLRRGRRVQVSPVAPLALGVTPSVTVTRRPPSVPMRWVARLLWFIPLGMLFATVIDSSDPSNGDMGSPLLYFVVTGMFLIPTAIPLALSYAAYRVVQGRPGVARGLVLGLGLVVFGLYGVVGWLMIAASEGGFRYVSVAGIVMLAIALAGVGAIVRYFVDAPSARNEPIRSGLDA